MAINFSDELKKYNERLTDEIETNKNDNSLDVSETDYKQKLSVDNLQTNLDAQSLIDGERDIDEDTEGIQTLIKVDNPKDGNEFKINIADVDNLKSEEKTFPNELENYKEKISAENTETNSDNAETENDLIGVLNPKDSLEDSKNYSDTINDYNTELGTEDTRTDGENISEAEEANVNNILTPKDNQNHLFKTENPESNRSLDTQGADGDNFNAIYQPVGSEFSDVGKIIQRSLGFEGGGEDNYKRIEDNLLDEEIDVFDPTSKVENSMTSKDLTFFIYNNIPYVIGRTANLVGGVVDSVQSVADNPENLLSQWGTVRLALDTMHQISYYSPDEMVKSLGQTFMTLQLLPFLKGISVKYKRMSFNSGTAEKFEDTFREAEKNFNAPETPYKDMQEWFDKTLGFLLQGIRSLFTNEENEVQDNVSYFKDVNTVLTGLREKYIKALRGQMEDVFEKKHEHFQKGNGPISKGTYYSSPFKDSNSDSGDGSFSKLSIKNEDPKSFDEKTTITHQLKNQEVSEYKKLLDDSLTYLLDDGNVDEESIEKVKSNTTNSLSDYITMIKERLSENLGSDPSIYERLKQVEGASEEKIEKELNDSKKTVWNSDNESSEISIWGDSDKVKSIAGLMKESVDDLMSKREMIKDFKGIHAIGYIMVYPTLVDGGAGTAFKIPFQFNPTIQESGSKVKYESQNLLHRQGNIYSYVGTEGQTISLETSYMMTTDGKDDNRTKSKNEFGNKDETKTWEVNNGPQDAWYSAWNPKTIQSLESALRSIALPQISGGDTDIKFHRPPMIKIIFGQHGANPVAHSKDNLYPMLTYPVNSNHNDPNSNDVKFYHRTYLVTSVNIVKDTNESPLHLNDKGDLIDTHEFKVQLELNEVDSNYVGIMPDFGDYYKTYKASADSYIEAVKTENA